MMVSPRLQSVSSLQLKPYPTGLEYTHSDLSSNYVSMGHQQPMFYSLVLLAQVAQYSFNYAVTNFNSDPSPPSGYSHGTNVAGQIAMTHNNTVCGVGVAYDVKLAGECNSHTIQEGGFEVFLAGLRLFGGSLTTDAQEAGALSHNRSHIHIYCNSWGPTDSGTVASRPDTLTQMALEQGTTMVHNHCDG